MTFIKAHELEAGDRFQLTGDACDSFERADEREYTVQKINKRVILMPDGKSFPTTTVLTVTTPSIGELEMAVAPWVPLILLLRNDQRP